MPYSAPGPFLGAQATTGYRISNSLRFRRSASAYLSRTLTTPTNNKIWTLSFWIKRANLAADQVVIGTTDNNTASANVGAIRFTSSNALEYYEYSSAYVVDLVTTQVFRDASAWYHVVIATDTSQATASNRIKFYVNGSQITSFSTATYPSLNYNPYINSAIAHYQGAYNNAGTGVQALADCYLAEVNFIDGQALTPSSFGENDATTGVWKPKAYTGTYGTNGFYLKFSDNSAATAAAIGKDSSGKGNNWTPTNISVTNDTTYDSMIDTPTNYDDGATGRGNYAVINPLDSFSTSGVTISAANLTVALDRTTYENWARASFVVPSSGKWYFEWTPTAVNTGTTPWFNGGVIAASTTRSTAYTTATFRGLIAGNGNKHSSAGSFTYGAATTTIPGTDYFMCAVDMDAGNIYFGKNGSWANGTGSFNQTFSTATAAFTDLISAGVTWMPFVYHNGQTTNTGSINFGQRPFGATPPSGFKALNTQNLP